MLFTIIDDLIWFRFHSVTLLRNTTNVNSTIVEKTKRRDTTKYIIIKSSLSADGLSAWNKVYKVVMTLSTFLMYKNLMVYYICIGYEIYLPSHELKGSSRSKSLSLLTQLFRVKDSREAENYFQKDIQLLLMANSMRLDRVVSCVWVWK